MRVRISPVSTMIESTQLWEILIPTSMNGHPIRTRHHREWDKWVRTQSSGLTLMPVVKGQWTEPDGEVVHEERIIPVRIACSAATLMYILAFTKAHYKQEAVMAYKVSDHAIVM